MLRNFQIISKTFLEKREVTFPRSKIPSNILSYSVLPKHSHIFKPLSSENSTRYCLILKKLKKELWIESHLAFQHIVAGDKSTVGTWWLDSARQPDPVNRFSFMGSTPALSNSFSTSYSTLRRRLLITCSNGSVINKKLTDQQTFWDWMSKTINYFNQRMDSLKILHDDGTLNDVKKRKIPFDFRLGMVGYFGYEMKRESLSGYTIPTNQHFPQTSNIPDSAFIFTTQAIIFDHLKREIWLSGLVRLGGNKSPKNFDFVENELGMCPGLLLDAYKSWITSIEKRLRSIDSFMSKLKQIPLKNKDRNEKFSSSIQTPFTPDMKRDAYIKAIEKARSYIYEGQSYELCLTTQFRTNFPKKLEYDWVELYKHIRSFNPAPFSALLYFSTEDICILSSSPEKFVQINNEGIMEMKPIKGTVARAKGCFCLNVDECDKGTTCEAGRKKEDMKRMSCLKDDVKERSENLMVPYLMKVESYETVHQLVTTVRGQLREGLDCVKAIEGCFPPGSMTGAPKLRAVQLLDELEQHNPRGVYSGCLGFISLQDGTGQMRSTSHFSVVIRTVIVCGETGEVTVGAGGAIVYLSNAESEWDEVVLKSQSVIPSGNVWRSKDAGANWDQVTDIPKNSATALYEHPFSNNEAYVLTRYLKHYKTSDKGDTWNQFTTEIQPARNDRALSFHAHRGGNILFRGSKCVNMFECKDVTYYTTDGFDTPPKLLLENMNNCIWAHSNGDFDEAPEQTIYCIYYKGSGSMRKPSDYRLTQSEDYFEHWDYVNFNTGGDVSGVIGLGTIRKYLVAAVKDINSLDMKMYVSTDGLKWTRALFPSNEGPTHKHAEENAYTILESSTSHLVVDLLSSDSHNTGNLFFSNSDGTSFVNRLKYTNRNNKGFVDFEAVQGVDGILLANIVSNHQDIDKGSAIAKLVQSKVSFDDGSSWNFIKPPEKSLGDTDFQCDSKRDWQDGTCSLHLHSITTTRNIGHIYSAGAAPGVLMGVGNVGSYLFPYELCDTFLSYDGGLTWKVVRLGAHLYEFGDSGSILVIVDNEQPTDRILYSYDRGENWYEHLLKNKIRARLLTTDPDSTTTKFLLLGSIVNDHDAPNNGGSNNQYYMFHLDFSNLFDRNCNDNDFETWVARNLETGPDCLMGKKSSYRRRKKDANCFVSSEFEKPAPIEELCQDNKCKLSGTERIPNGECRDGKKTYLGSSGYRKIPGNVCDPDKPGSKDLATPIEKPCQSDGEVSHKVLDVDLDYYFYFPNSQVLIAKTTDGKIIRSKDEGTNWSNVLDGAGIITHMKLHDHDQNRAYFFSDQNDMWYTTDRGETFEKSKLDSEPNKLNLPLLDFHPKNSDWLLFMASTSCPGCYSITYFSSDNGKTWKNIETWAQKCIFGRDTNFPIDDNTIFCSSYKDKKSKTKQDELGGRSSDTNPLQLVKLKTDGSGKVVLLNDGVVEFFIFNEFMAVATEEHGQLTLRISKDGETFNEAIFPPDISVDKQAYTILQSTTGSVFLDAYKSILYGSEHGSLFKSNSKGTAFDKILDNTNRNNRGNVDFEKVQGLDGIILANIVDNANELGGGSKKIIKTMISYDDGSVYSASPAIGLLIGVGNTGDQLLPYTECNTFMSRDGGRNWKEIRRGESLHAYGDRGTIIVVVDDEAPTDHVLYSWNYGKDWNKYIFSSTPVRARFIINSNSNGMKFLLFGYTVPANKVRPVMVTIDFTQLKKRKYNDVKNDFELWNPMDKESDDHKCLLGEEIRFWRRKADRECHIGDMEDDLITIQKNCECTKHDFECDIGFWRDENRNCVLKGPDPLRPPNCPEDGTYIGRSGYVKMEKSKCKGGNNLGEKIERNCKLENTGIISKTKVFENRIAKHFYSNESTAILARTMDHTIWRSIDEGYSWNTIAMPDDDARIIALVQNSYFSNYVYFITSGKKHYYTDDFGETIKSLVVPAEPNGYLAPIILDFHPSKSEYLIYTVGKNCETFYSENCHTEAFYTRNNGETWDLLDTYVVTCSWARDKNFKVSPDLIFCDSYRDKKGSQLSFINNPRQLVSSTDFFKNKKLHYQNIVGFAVFEEFMVVAELMETSASLRLWVSVDAEHFAEARFPPNMPITREVRLHYDRGYVDFEKMQGIRGIALANIVSNVNEVIMGSIWSFLKRPDVDSDGNTYECDTDANKNDTEGRCSLHLHSFTERRNPSDSFSSSSAVGLMMGVGNVGDYLTPYLDGDTFLTRDAGVTWKEIKKGAYMYEFGDQGGILVLVDDERETDRVFYSLNEGYSWQEYKFLKSNEQPIRIFDIEIKPGGLSSKFILRGLLPSDYNKEVIVHLDFTNAFVRNCKDDDFEPWSPSHAEHSNSENQCLFGRRITYQRKKLDTECFIKDYKPVEEGGICECKKHDFECDYNYMRNATDHCVLVSPDAKPLVRDISEQCANGEEFWYEVSGYRKLAITKCTGGSINYTGESHRCPGHHSALFWIFVVLSPFVIVGILTICFINKRHERHIRLGSSLEPNSILSSIIDIFYQIKIPRFISRLWSKVPLPGRGYRYSSVATDDGHEVLMDDYDRDIETS
ncbi:5724_t:CDS:10 [Funneliformis geosporum]|uniref:Vacuolar protein sorting/targeting protein 10 n=1 Tax=Funneliformis geosporum TaxID=1117311 RepID=A0A9W4SMK5_9GLOM|nr:5724_t:CDS:10 [Funneliformis geosporum]